MRILKIIHGYPPEYNAGSEVYSQMLCHGLAKNNEVHVLTREENPFAEDFTWNITQDNHHPSITLHKINIPLEKYRYRYQHPYLDKRVESFIDRIKPQIVHIGHLNHLSTSLVDIIAKKNIPMVYTLHDYWLMCPRGQFIQRNPDVDSPLWSLCDGQKNKKCATYCYSGYFSGNKNENSIDIAYWTNWVKRRMHQMYQVAEKIKYFIAPSFYLYHRYITDFGLPPHKMIYLDYGFDLDRLSRRQRLSKEDFTFGYIGTHIPAKGIQLLIQAFSRLGDNCRLRIWGRPRPQNTAGLQVIAAKLPSQVQSRIEWLPEYSNEKIIKTVFNHVDCIVVPSIWVENSPLVIHEALQARIPVITANIGGMAEYVYHEINGLLFEHRNEKSLSEQMQRLVNHPSWAKKLGLRGYIQSPDGNIPSQKDHVAEIEKIYKSLL
ncbi:glycosyltransferase [Arsenophonus sp. PmNCSU2021_1]|uniref:glycosyltransferase n=1 Tax=Arsenophonus sp. PmNCSU2021_1 TaxID=3118989 RepID=UPI002FEE9B63